MANQEFLTLLRADVSAANQYRSENPGFVPDLIGVDLAGLDLEGANLEDAYLRFSKLRGTNLKGANLRGTNLRVSDLRGANLKKADLEGADLSNANLIGANLIETRLRNTEIRGTGFRKTCVVRFCVGVQVFWGCVNTSTGFIRVDFCNYESLEEFEANFKQDALAYDRTTKQIRECYVKVRAVFGKINESKVVQF